MVMKEQEQAIKNNNNNMIKRFNNYLTEKHDLEGKRVRLIYMDNDPHPIEPDTEGTIKLVDGLGQLHVDWDNGRKLALIPDVDKYIILNEGYLSIGNPVKVTSPGHNDIDKIGIITDRNGDFLTVDLGTHKIRINASGILDLGINENVNEELDAVTIGMVGSGTAVTGYPTGSFTNSAGQAVYGGDSDSSFAGNSNAGKLEQEVPCPPKHIFKEVGSKKKRKEKSIRRYNQLGTDIDKLHIVNKKAKNENMKTWEEFNILNEDEGGGASAGDGGGVSSATLGNTGGMGAIVSAQPSSIPGDVAGSTKGSGDIGQPLGVYSKYPFKKKNKKDKRDKPYHKIGAGIDNFYVTKYTETKNNGGRIIASWDAFTNTK